MLCLCRKDLIGSWQRSCDCKGLIQLYWCMSRKSYWELPSIAYVTGWFAYASLYISCVCACASSELIWMMTRRCTHRVLQHLSALLLFSYFTSDPVGHLFITCCMLCVSSVGNMPLLIVKISSFLQPGNITLAVAWQLGSFNFLNLHFRKKWILYVLLALRL